MCCKFALHQRLSRQADRALWEQAKRTTAIFEISLLDSGCSCRTAKSNQTRWRASPEGTLPLFTVKAVGQRLRTLKGQVETNGQVLVKLEVAVALAAFCTVVKSGEKEEFRGQILVHLEVDGVFPLGHGTLVVGEEVKP